MPFWRRLGKAGPLVFMLYLVLSLLLTYPLALHFTTHVVGSNVDEGTFVWNLWWVKHALVDLHTSPLYTDQIFYPVGLSLVFYTLTLFNGLAAMPLLLVVSPITANNLVFIFSLTLSGFGAYLLVRHLLGENPPLPRTAAATGVRAVLETSEDPANGRPSRLVIHLAAILGGLVYAFPASRFVYASLGQANLTSTAWLPFFVLYLFKMVAAARGGQRLPFTLPLLSPRLHMAWLAYGFCAGLFLLFAVLTELTYGAFLALFGATYLLAVMWKGAWSRAAVSRLAGGLLVAAAVFLLGFTPVLVPAAQQSAAGYVDDRWGGADQFSADLLSFLVPSRLHPVLGATASEWSAGMTDLPIVFVGFAVLALSIVGALRYRRRLAFWWLSALGYMVLCLGPVLHIAGVSQFDFDGLKMRFALPFVVLHYIPLVKANRVPNRFSILTSLCLAVLVGFAVAWLLGKLEAGRRPRHGSRATRPSRSPFRFAVVPVCAVLGGAILFEHLAAPLPLTDATPPPVYREIARERGDFAILQLPLGWRNSYGIQGTERTILQSYQAVHGKRILGGNTSRNPEFKFRYFAEVPLFRSIIALEEGRPLEEGALERDRSLASALLAFYDLRYLVVHRDLVDPAVERYLLSVLPAEKFYEEDGVAAYRLAVDGRAAAGTIDLGTPGAAMSRGEGWGRDEVAAGDVTINWAVSRNPSLLFALPAAANLRMTVRLMPFIYSGMPDQIVQVLVNGRIVDRTTLQATWQERAFSVPASAVHPGINNLALRFTQITSPSKVMDSTDRRDLAAAVDLVRWEVVP